MSTKYRELVEAESVSDDDDADEPTEDAPTEPTEDEPTEPLAPAEPTEPAAPELDEQAMAKAQKAIAAHLKKMATLIGAENVAETCPLCAGAGGMAGLPEPGTKFELTLTEHGYGFAFEEPEPEPELIASKDSQTCEACAGFGWTISGSKVPEHRKKICGTCNGTGWTALAYVPPPYTPPVPTGAVFLPNGTPEVDRWGRRQGEPHYGVDPMYVAV